MSDNKDKPDDPDATVSMPRKKPVDDDATVAMSRDALKRDDDATVAMSRDALLEKPADDDVTVTNMTREALMAQEPRPKSPTADEDATVTMTPGGFRPPSERDLVAAAPVAAAAGSGAASLPPQQDLSAEPSRMPMIAGAIVVVLVLLYFMFGGEKKDTAKPAETASSSSTTTPAPAPSSSPSTAAPAPSTSAATPPSTPSPSAATTSTSASPSSASPAPSSTASASSAPSPAPSASSASGATTPSAPAASAPAAAPGGSSKVKDLLAADIKRGTVAVAEEGGNVTITFPMSHQFASGGTEPEPKLRAALASIGAALDKAPGNIVVTGHADAKPSSNPKYPSNQALSEARGAAAAKILGGKLRDAKRVSSEGASDSKPLASGDSQEDRAKNRRVVVVLKP